MATEVQLQLKKSGQVTLDAAGSGTLYFDPDSANQRWEVTGVVVSTDQPATSTVVPVATVALNSHDMETMSAGNQRGTSWSGNNDSFGGPLIDVSPGDFLAVIFAPPPGATASEIAQLSGVIASAVVTGTKYTRRA